MNAAHKIWIEHCGAARLIKDAFGEQPALEYLIGEKFVNYLELAEDNPQWRTEIPSFVEEIRELFERWRLAQYLDSALPTKPFDPDFFDDETDPQEVEEMRQEDIRQCTHDLLLVERARDWLLEDA